VVTSQVSREMAGELADITFQVREPVKVKGKSEPIEIFVVTRRGSA
jgi:class 3 adenylate cyclase